MDRRDFLKKASDLALPAIGAATEVSHIFARIPDFPQKNETEKLPGNNHMEYRHLGRLNVSAIGLGCPPMVGYYGGKYDKQEMIALMEHRADPFTESQIDK